MGVQSQAVTGPAGMLREVRKAQARDAEKSKQIWSPRERPRSLEAL